ncbi:VanW family protein, partial [Eubacteriales bacterium OttesenSCG-928-A19]|nr:VanW family protein [Eubacteriales bacterium OttesenSCG-928-A19]
MSYRQGYRPQTGTQTTQRRSTAAATKRKTTRTAPRKTTGKRKKGNRSLKIFLALVVVALIAAVGATGYMMTEEVRRVERLNTFYKGVYVDGVPLYGATPQEAYDFLVANARSELENFMITLEYAGQTWTITSDTLGMTGAVEAAVQDAVNKAFFVGRSDGNILERYREIMALRDNPYEGYTADVDKNTANIDAMVSEIQALAYRAPVDAQSSFDATRGTPLMIVNEQYGQEVDASALRAQILDMVTRMDSGTIQVQPRMTEPAVKASTLEGNIAMIGRYETEISSRSTDERTKNVERGCQAFNGLKVQPGERVSFNRIVGERTAKNGFFPAEEIVSGSYEMGIGGGICQVSSTLYNAVIKANLKVRSRTNHGIPVNYMEMGADATVSDRGIDFVFENNTEDTIYIVSRVDGSGKKKTCVFEIYGRPEPNGYSYSLKHETIEEIPVPEPNYIIDYEVLHVTYRDQE